MATGDVAFSRGDIMRRLQLIESELRQLRSARSLEAATIREGGLTVKGGTVRVTNTGQILVEDGGDVRVIEGGDVVVEGGNVQVTDGNVALRGGGSVTVSDGGNVNVLADGTIVIQSGGMRVENNGIIRSADFDGDMSASDPGSVGWALGADRLALLGAMVVPVEWHADFNSGNGWSASPTVDVKTSITVNVPDWAGEAGVIAMSMISARNDSASSDIINGRSRVDGINGQQFSKGVDVGEVFDVTLGQAEVITVTPGDSFQCDIQVWTDSNNWPSNTANNAALSILVMFRSTP